MRSCLSGEFIPALAGEIEHAPTLREWLIIGLFGMSLLADLFPVPFITPAAKKVIYQPNARARGPVRLPRSRVGLICSSMRNFLAGVIGFGVGRGFAISSPFPVQAPDNAPERWTWSTMTENHRFGRWAWVGHIRGPFAVPHHRIAPPETWTWSTRSEGGCRLARPQPRRKPDRVQVPSMCWTCGSLVW